VLAMLMDLGRRHCSVAADGGGAARARSIARSGFSSTSASPTWLTPRLCFARSSRGTNDVECLAACLRVFADVDDLDTVREYLHHEIWQVRVQAVNVLGRLGSAHDYSVLLPLLSDLGVVGRYRTAKALCSLPGIELSQIHGLSRKHADGFARDMLVTCARGGRRVISAATIGEVFAWAALAYLLAINARI
jgi:hypothetical protein